MTVVTMVAEFDGAMSCDPFYCGCKVWLGHEPENLVAQLIEFVLDANRDTFRCIRGA